MRQHRKRLENALDGIKPSVVVPLSDNEKLSLLRYRYALSLENLAIKRLEVNALKLELRMLKRIKKEAMNYIAWTRQRANNVKGRLRVGGLARACDDLKDMESAKELEDD